VDAAFSAEVLRVANSPLLGCRQECAAFSTPWPSWGLDRLKGLVMTVALRNFLAAALDVPVLLRCWRHSLACALLCEQVAEPAGWTRTNATPQGSCTTWAACPCSKPTRQTTPASSKPVDEDQGEPPATLMEYEREMFDADHCEIGRWLAEDWDSPSKLQDIIGKHHEARQNRDAWTSSRSPSRLHDRGHAGLSSRGRGETLQPR